MKIIFDYNRTIFNPETNDLYEGVFSVLHELSKKHELFLVSMNEASRKNTVKNLGIEVFFKKVLFVDSKSIEVFSTIGNAGENILVVGDSIRNEISIGNKMNFITVWIKQGMFSNILPITKEQKPKHTISDISELKEILKKYE